MTVCIHLIFFLYTQSLCTMYMEKLYAYCRFHNNEIKQKNTCRVWLILATLSKSFFFSNAMLFLYSAQKATQNIFYHSVIST